MLPKKNRLNREEFNNVWKNGKRVHSPVFTFIFVNNLEKKGNFSCVISKKVQKTAVKRNLLRRSIYGSIDTLNGRNIGISGIFILKPEVKDLNKQDLLKNVEKTFNIVL